MRPVLQVPAVLCRITCTIFGRSIVHSTQFEFDLVT